MNLFPIEGKFSLEEEKALQALAIKQEMSGLGILRQALRAYQLIVAGTHELREINPDPKLDTAELPNQTYDQRAVEIIRSLDAETATLRAEVERLTQLIEQVKQEITEEPTIGRTVDILFREPLEKAEAENRELTATVARLTGERDAAVSQLAECYRLSGADPDGNEDWRLASRAVEEVRRLRKEYDEEEDKLLNAYFQDQTIAPDGKLRPTFAKLINRAETSETALSKAQQALRERDNSLTSFCEKHQPEEGERYVGCPCCQVEELRKYKELAQKYRDFISHRKSCQRCSRGIICERAQKMLAYAGDLWADLHGGRSKRTKYIRETAEAALPSDTPQTLKAHSKSEYKRLVVQTEGKDVVVEPPSDTQGAQAQENELCAACHHVKNDSTMHFDAKGTNWGAALHWFQVKEK